MAVYGQGIMGRLDCTVYVRVGLMDTGNCPVCAVTDQFKPRLHDSGGSVLGEMIAAWG
jgi:hypothetical protein